MCRSLRREILFSFSNSYKIDNDILREYYVLKPLFSQKISESNHVCVVLNRLKRGLICAGLREMICYRIFLMNCNRIIAHKSCTEAVIFVCFDHVP